MLAAMADPVLHISNVPVAGWAMVLLLAALASGFLDCRVPTAPDLSKGFRDTALHRNIGLILMAVLLLFMESHSGALGGGGSHGAHGRADLLGLLVLGGPVLYLAASIRMTFRAHHTRVCDRLDAGFMGLSVMTMAGSNWM